MVSPRGQVYRDKTICRVVLLYRLYIVARCRRVINANDAKRLARRDCSRSIRSLLDPNPIVPIRCSSYWTKLTSNKSTLRLINRRSFPMIINSCYTNVSNRSIYRQDNLARGHVSVFFCDLGIPIPRYPPISIFICVYIYFFFLISKVNKRENWYLNFELSSILWI